MPVIDLFDNCYSLFKHQIKWDQRIVVGEGARHTETVTTAEGTMTEGGTGVDPEAGAQGLFSILPISLLILITKFFYNLE